MAGGTRVDVLLLGPVEVTFDGRPVSLGARKQRAVLAMRALQAGRAVSADRLAEGLWGESAPPSAAKMVQLYVSQLRQILAGSGAEIGTRGRAYELQLGGGQVDAVRFAALLEQARPREALALWRNEPLSDVADQPFAAAEIRHLEELRLQAVEAAIDSDLAAGRHRDVLGELQALLDTHPLRERLHAQWMLALYRAGRQADALAAYRHARGTLVERVGVEPGPELRRLHEAILRQDAWLEPPVIDAGGLPPELDTGTPLTGRDSELERLRGHWRRARGGAGALVVVAGAAGMGKTRLVAELAAEVVRERGVVVYASGVPEDALAAAEAALRPTLLVLEGVDRATGEQRAALAGLREALPVLVVATAADGVELRPRDTLTLAPLDAGAARAVVRGYVGAGVDVPVDDLLAVSGRVPRRLHDVAAEWARGLAARRVGDAAGRIAAERPVLRAAEDDLAGGIVALQAGRERAEDAGGDVVVCPFKGLACFDVEDGAYFCGREQLVAELVARLTGAPLLGIVGASGSGKSSTLRAGLLAALAAGVLPGSERWPQALPRPGEHPLRALEDALAEVEPGGRSVIAVDQFEELFTACRDEDERVAFVEALVACTRDPRRRVLVLVAVRADFYGRCAAYPELARLLGANHVLVGPMRRDELRRAIELPARRAGLRVEADLVDALVAGVDGEPGALPWLSTSLLELWRDRDGRTLRLAAYERAGGVHGAVARLAERAYERLDPGQRPVARRILLRLAGEGEGDAVVRRRVELAELEGEDAGAVLAVLAGERLVTIGEVAHEALLREWPRLRGWLQEDAEARRVQRHLTGAARDWLAVGRDRGSLYRGARLAAALDWSAGRERELSGLEREFLAESRAEAESESLRQRQANRRLRALLGGVAGLLVLALAAGALAVAQRGQARESAVVADAQRLGAEALTRERFDQALLLARAGVELDDSAVTRGHLLSVLLREPRVLGTLAGDGWPLFNAEASPDGRLVALAGASGVVTFLDAAGRPSGKSYRLADSLVLDLEFSPDGRTLAVAGHGPSSAGGVVDLVDTRTHARRLRIALPPFPEPAQYVGVGVLFAPDGRDVIVQQVHGPTDPAGPASVLRRFDGATGAAEGPLVRVGRHSTFQMWGTGDRRRLFVTSGEDGATTMLDADRLRVLRRWPVGDDAGTVSADGSAFALGSDDGEVRVLDLRSGRVRGFAGRHDGEVMRLRFTPDARTLVTAGEDGKLIVWDVAAGTIRDELSGHASGSGLGLALSPDGRTAYSAGEDERAFAWDLTGERGLVRPFAAERPFVPDDGDTLPRGVALSPDGRTLAIGHSDGVVDLLDARTLRPRGRLRALRGFVGALAFSPDGRLLAATGQHGTITLWDARTLRARGELRGQRTTSQALAFSPDGTLLAAAELGEYTGAGYEGGSVRVWDARRRVLTGVSIPRSAPALAFSPDGRLLALALMELPTEIRDARSGRLVATLRTPDVGRSVAFSPDGGQLATGHYDGTGRLWSTESWHPVGRVFEAHDGKRLLSLAFTPDGAMLATAGQDGTIALTDAASQNPIGSPLNVDADNYLSTALAPDGSHLFAVSANRAAVRWNIVPAAWKQHACRVAGRELTPREWDDALPGRPYRRVCGAG